MARGMLQPSAVGRRLFLVLLCAAFLWTGTAHADTGILAVGDFGVGGTTEREMGVAMKRFEANHPAALLLTLGDNDYTESPSAFHRTWTASFGWLGSAGLRVAGTLGNHDIRVNGGRYEYDELDMPRTHYRRTAGNVTFFILNSNRVNSIQTEWLKKVLPASTATWKVVVFHHPAWTCGGYRSNTAIVQTWVPLFERYGVQLVLNGHDHNYQRFGPRHGVRYIVHGGGGQHLYPIERCPASYPTRRFARAVHGFLYLRATDTALRVSSVTRRRNIIDTVVIYP
jgi:calcineurin-like phosphoesterase family protein